MVRFNTMVGNEIIRNSKACAEINAEPTGGKILYATNYSSYFCYPTRGVVAMGMICWQVLNILCKDNKWF